MGKWTKRGLPDILLILPPTGKLIGLEVKAPTSSRISSDQRERKKEFEELGATYEVVRSVQDVEQVLSSLLHRDRLLADNL